MASDSPFPVLTGTLEPPPSPSSGRCCGHPGAFMSSAAQGGRASIAHVPGAVPAGAAHAASRQPRPLRRLCPRARSHAALGLR